MNTQNRQPFQFSYPVWTLCIDIGDDSQQQVILRDTNRGDYFPLFTDSDLAERYIEDFNHPEYSLQEIETPSLLIGYLRHAQQNGITSAGIDPAKNRQSGIEIGMIGPIQELLNHWTKKP